MKNLLNITGITLLGIFLILAILGLCGIPSLILYSLIPGVTGNIILFLAMIRTERTRA